MTTIRIKRSLFLLVMFNLLIMNAFNLSFINGIVNQQENWVSFEIQDCGPSILFLYEKEEGENQDFVVNVEVYNLSNMKLGISSTRKTDEIYFVMEYFPILKIGLNTITFSSVSFSLELDTVLNKTIKHYITVSGQYQINEGEWQEFELQNCYPRMVIIFQDLKFEYNLTIDLNVTEMIGKMMIDYCYSDICDTINLFKEGKYSYNLMTQYICLILDIHQLNLLDNYGKATGWYKITTYERYSISSMVGFELLFLISIAALWYVADRHPFR